MPKIEDTAAYDLALFSPKSSAEPARRPEEEIPRRAPKKSNVIEIPKERYAQVRKTRRRGRNRSAVAKILLMVAGAAIALFLIIGQVRLAELTEQIESTKKELEEAQSLYTQYQMKTDSQLSLSSIEKFATNNLGMVKENQGQMVYVEMSAEDKGEVIQQENTNWIGAAWNFIVNILS